MMETTNSGVVDPKDLQGAWQLVGGWVIDDKGNREKYQAGDMFNQIKVWSGNQFICVGKYKNGDKYFDNFACGKFSLDGKKYGEDFKYHATKSYVGSKINLSMEMKGDTLIQAWPADAMGNVDEGKSNCEKYIRIK